MKNTKGKNIIAPKQLHTKTKHQVEGQTNTLEKGQNKLQIASFKVSEGSKPKEKETTKTNTQYQWIAPRKLHTNPSPKWKDKPKAKFANAQGQ